jgi:hypothetical protein
MAMMSHDIHDMRMISITLQTKNDNDVTIVSLMIWLLSHITSMI